MRRIHKGAEPRSLARYRLQSHAYWDGYPDKQGARVALCREQGHLCGFCQRRIVPQMDAMKIAHWAPRAGHDGRARELDWDNMLGACLGGMGKVGEKRAAKDQHCDTAQGAQSLPDALNPITHDPAAILRYLGDGQIEADESRINRASLAEIRVALDRTLNLNHAPLKDGRRAALTALAAAMPRMGAWPADRMRRKIEQYENPGPDGRLPEHCGAVLYYLRRRLQRL